MRGKWTKLAWIALVMILIVVGCSSKAIFPTGIFANKDWTWEFFPDGSYYADGPDAHESGTYSVTGDQITIEGDFCPEIIGTYTWTYKNEALSFRLISDKCTSRMDTVRNGQWLKQP